jgi:hypothetical protein
MQPARAVPKSPSRSRAAWIGGGAVAIALAFGTGRLTSEADPMPPARPAAPELARESVPAPADPSTWARPPTLAPAPRRALATASAAPYRAPVPPERMAEYRMEVVTRVEEERPRVVSTCWPKEGLPNGRRSATITYNVTFNPAGREVARGIVQDRRAPAGQFGKCLGQLRGTQLSISPPGTYVTLRVPVTYP